MADALPPQTRRDLIRRLIRTSPYGSVLSRYEEDIDRVAAEHEQISGVLAALHRTASPRGLFCRRPDVRDQLRTLRDFLEFIYFSTPEAYRYISREQQSI